MGIENYKKEIRENDFAYIPLLKDKPDTMFYATNLNHAMWVIMDASGIINNYQREYDEECGISVHLHSTIAENGCVNVKYVKDVDMSAISPEGVVDLKGDVFPEKIEITCVYHFTERKELESEDFQKVYTLDCFQGFLFNFPNPGDNIMVNALIDLIERAKSDSNILYNRLGGYGAHQPKKDYLQGLRVIIK